MSLETARQFLQRHAPEIDILEMEQSTATVTLAAQAHGVTPGQIAKTLALRTGDLTVVVVARGDVRLDNRKLRQAFGKKTKMLPADEVASLTGHPVGGVCPFGLPEALPIYCDQSLREFDMVLPAAGDTNTAVRIAPDRLAEITGARWIDVCQSAPGGEPSVKP